MRRAAPRPSVGAIVMSVSTVIVAINARLLSLPGTRVGIRGQPPAPPPLHKAPGEEH